MNPVRPLVNRYKPVWRSNRVKNNLAFLKVRSNRVKKSFFVLAMICLAGMAWGYEVTFKEKPVKLPINKIVPLVFNVGTVDLAEIGGQKMHLVLVDLDLEMMFHCFPAADAAGNFSQDVVFPQDGRYLLYFYFQPSGQAPVVKIVPLDVGKVVNKFGTVRMYLDNEKITADWQAVRFTTEPEEIKEKTEINFTFLVAEMKSGKPVQNLLPYAGGGAQLVAINATQDIYLQKQSVEQGLAAYGPELHFKVIFPKKGIYKLWLEFRSKKKMNTVPFTLQVK